MIHSSGGVVSQDTLRGGPGHDRGGVKKGSSLSARRTPRGMMSLGADPDPGRGADRGATRGITGGRGEQ